MKQQLRLWPFVGLEVMPVHGKWGYREAFGRMVFVQDELSAAIGQRLLPAVLEATKAFTDFGNAVRKVQRG